MKLLALSRALLIAYASAKKGGKRGGKRGGGIRGGNKGDYDKPVVEGTTAWCRLPEEEG